MKNVCRIVFADDHPLVLAGMSDYFANDVIFKIVGTATTSTDLVESIEKNAPEIVVTDFSMPGDIRYGDGLQFISYLRRKFPEIRILVVTMISNPLIIQSLYRAGVAGVVLKSDEMAALRTALTTIRVGRVYTHPSLDGMDISSGSSQALKEPSALLSPREIEVLRHFIAGRPLKEIALDLNRSIKTVSNQKRSAMTKLNVSTDQDLISYCAINKLFE